MPHLHFGFSYVGLLFLLMLFIPNIIWIKYKPENYEKETINENKILQWLERIGQASVTCIVLIFSDFNITQINYWSLFLLSAFIMMIFYEIFWIRYFFSKREMGDFYCKLFGIPVPGATLPILAFVLLSLYGKNIFLLLAAIILGIGHIGIHVEHYIEIKKSSVA